LYLRAYRPCSFHIGILADLDHGVQEPPRGSLASGISIDAGVAIALLAVGLSATAIVPAPVLPSLVGALVQPLSPAWIGQPVSPGVFWLVFLPLMERPA
jgi:hypothetical protein